MRFYHIALGFWLFMLTLNMVNSLGIFQYQMPAGNLNSSTGQAQITQLTNTVGQSTDYNTFFTIASGFGMILKSFGYMKEVFVDSIIFTCPSHTCIADVYGIDSRISGLFQAVYFFILIFGLYQWFTGRSTKIME